MTRTEALAAATKVVDDFAPRTNARGYSDGALTPGARVELVLKVADWLLLEAAVPGQPWPPVGSATFGEPAPAWQKTIDDEEF